MKQDDCKAMAEILGQVINTIDLLIRSSCCTQGQREWLTYAIGGLQTVIDEWTEEEKPKASSSEMHMSLPMKATGALLDMLDVYYHDIDEQDFTPQQRVRIMLAAQHLLAVYEEVKVGGN